MATVGDNSKDDNMCRSCLIEVATIVCNKCMDKPNISPEGFHPSLTPLIKESDSEDCDSDENAENAENNKKKQEKHYNVEDLIKSIHYFILKMKSNYEFILL
jgi:hypothetical protein